MVNKLFSLVNRRNLYGSLCLLLVMMVGMNVGATAFYRFTQRVGLLDTAGGANVFDSRMKGYTPELAYQMIAAYGEPGIKYHLFLTAADMFFPVAFALVLTMAIVYSYRPLFPSRVIRWLMLLPAFYLAADYLENVGIVTMLLSFPSFYPLVAWISDMMFILKNISSLLAVIVIVIGLGTRLFLQRSRLRLT